VAERFKACLIEGCNNNAAKPGAGRGWCTKHYQRWQSNGDPLKSKINREQTGKACSVEDCERKSGYHGMCQMHFSRLKYRGSTSDEDLHPRYRRVMKWLENHVSYQGDECLKWPFHVGDQGRGTATWEGRQMSAPKVMCIMAHGLPPTDDHEAAHSCGKGHEGCISPKHLRWATRGENHADMVEHGTIRRGVLVNTNKLSVRQVREIRAMGKSKPPREIAAMFDISHSTVWEIQTRRSWAWLP
jgi:hypothetical protein